MLGAIYGVSQAWSSVNPATLVQLWRKLLADLEDDLQGFSNEKISMSKILDMVCTMTSFENVAKHNVKEWLQSDACELGFQHMTVTDIVNASAKQKGGKEGGEDDSEEEGQSSECISHSMALHCVDTISLHGSERVQIQ
jgi:hypothetical protein